MAIENVSGERLATRRTSHQQGQLPVGNGLFREVIVDDQCMLALVHEVLGQCGTRVGRDVLQRRRIGTRGRDDAAVIHRTMFGQHVDHGGHRTGSLATTDVDADDVPTLLVEDRVQGNGGLAGLAVTDDQFTLSPADRCHRVDRLDASLQRLCHRLPRGHAWSWGFQGTGLG